MIAVGNEGQNGEEEAGDEIGAIDKDALGAGEQEEERVATCVVSVGHEMRGGG